MRYRAEIDGLRAVAVIPVILFHAGIEAFDGGFVGVDVFFVISGYLITSIILSDLNEGKFSLANFYERRARRILPALFFVMAACVPISYIILLPSYLIDFGESLVAVPLFISNFLFWSERGYFGGATDLKPLIHTWSLAVEEQFYIFYPPLLLLLLKYKKSVIIAFAILSLVISLTASWYLTKLHFDTAFYLPMARAWELLVGALAAFLLFGADDGLRIFPRTASLLGLALIAIPVLVYDRNTPFPGLYATVPVIGTFLIIVASSRENVVHRILSTKYLVFAGLMSYSLYLWHQPIFSFIVHAELGDYYLYSSFPIVAAASFISYKFVERPVRKGVFKNQRAVFLASFCASILFVAIGMTIVMNEGFIQRYNKADTAILAQFAKLEGYNQRRFDALELADFDSSNRKKVLIVGDSFGKDFVNILFEGGFDKTHQFSTKQINTECGNIYGELDYDEFIPEQRAERCKVMGRFDSDRVRSLALEADEIWLVSAWKSWVVEFLPQTVVNLRTDFDADIKVVGLKNFGRVSQRNALEIEEAMRPHYTQPGSEEAIRINEEMKRVLPQAVFFDVMDSFCSGDARNCKIFTQNGALISPDGGHITQEGARFLATKLAPFIDQN